VDRKLKRFDQFDYERMSINDNWHFAETLELLVCVKMEANGYYNSSDALKIYNKLYDMYDAYLTNIMFGNILPYTTPYDEETYSQDQSEGYDSSRTIHPKITYFNKLLFIDILRNNNKAKIDVDKLVNFIDGVEVPENISETNVTTSESASTNSDSKLVASVDDGCLSDDGDDLKYITIKGINFEELTSDKFTEIKKYYGMLQVGESKYRRALPIAAKIGLLFYERSLNKPTTRPAFLDAYKQEFDAILPNDTLAKEIYSQLPEEYRGGSKPTKPVSDIDPIINAAVFAGAQASNRDSMNIVRLKKSLTLENYAIPQDDVLNKIIAAVGKLDLDE